MAWNNGFSLVVVCLLLTACSPAAHKPNSKGDAKAADNQPVVSAPKIANVLPNPYLAQAGNAPAAAQQAFASINAAIKAGRLSDAERDLLSLHKAFPKLSGPLVNLALVSWKQKNTSAAQGYFEQAQATNKLNGDAYTQYAIMLREQGKFAEAETQYQKAIAVWPHNYEAHRSLGVLYDLYQGKPEQALQQFQLCDQLSPEPSKEIKGWILELQRRIGKKAGE